MKNSIKTRLRLILLVMTVVSIVVCVLIAFFYSSYQLRRHILTNEKSKIELIASELDEIATDVEQVGMLLAFNDHVQRYLSSETLTTSEKIDLQETIKNEMKNYILQRDYIINFVLLGEDKLLVSNSQHGIYVSENDYMDLMEQNKYSILNSSDMQFQYGPAYQLRLHMQTTVNNMEAVTVFPYIIDVADKNDIWNTFGRILVNVGFEYMYERIRNGLNDTDDFLFYDSHQEKIFQMHGNATEAGQEELLRYAGSEQCEQNQAVTLKADKGYYTLYSSGESGWLIASFIDENSVLMQSAGLFFLCFIVMCFLILAAVFASRRIAESITRPIVSLTETVQKITDGDTDSRVDIISEDEIGVLAERFNRMVTKLNQSYEQNLALEKETRKIELDLLSAQINPHFIYNTLQTIIYLAAKDQSSKVMELTRSFIRLLQNTVKISDNRMEVMLKEEIAAVRDYIAVQNYRYKDKFSVSWDIEPETEECLVPKTSLQPIVENSLLHGIFLKEDGCIHVCSYCVGDELFISVEDNGVGMEEEKIARMLTQENTEHDSMRTIGISNVLNRIHYLYGDDYGIEIRSSVNEYTKITMKIPKKPDICTK